LRTARHFVSRALLAAESLDDAVKILSCSGASVADGLSINLGFFRTATPSADPLLHNIEVAPGFPSADDKHPGEQPVQSLVEVLTISPGEHLVHLNTFVIFRSNSKYSLHSNVANIAQLPTPL
jgi:hypothetical protein